MALGHTVAWEVFLPAAVLPGVVFGLCFAWPAIERWYTKDNDSHNLLDFPRNRPKRTAAGATMFAFLMMLFIASATDVLANYFHISLNTVLWIMRVTVILVPVITFPVTYLICKELQGVQGAGKRKRANVVFRTAQGEYLAVPADPRPGDGHHELDAEPVPTFIDLDDSGADADEGSAPGTTTVGR